jgi:hydroxypyruvate reductase
MNQVVPEYRRFRDQLVELFRSAIEAAQPGPAVLEALRLEPGGTQPFIIAIGKAAIPMARAALTVLEERGDTPRGGVVVCPVPAPIDGLEVIAGDHPVPGDGSVQAADAIEALCREVFPGARVWVLLSGGATSLIAGPDVGLTLPDLQRTFEALLRSGLDIEAMNLVRKRLTRWGGGKLAAALQGAEILQLIVSDVIGDDLPSIGSGPLVPDQATAATVLSLLTQAAVQLPEPAMSRLSDMASGRWPETPRPGDPALAHVTTRIVVSNQRALEAVAARARNLGWHVAVATHPLAGEAAAAGRAIARELASLDSPPCPSLLVYGGEPTVHIEGTPGRGGRAQELALAAAEVLAAHPDRRILVLAGGTDGRDGPTDAAGAVTDGTTWARLLATAENPALALARHDSYAVLEHAGALLKTGPTGTNVMDVVLGLRLPDAG